MRDRDKMTAHDKMRSLAAGGKFRVDRDSEGFPIIPGKFGRIEWHDPDGRELAVYTIARGSSPGCSPYPASGGTRPATMSYAPSSLWRCSNKSPTSSRPRAAGPRPPRRVSGTFDPG